MTDPRETLERYVQSALELEVGAFAAAGSGGRSDALNRAAFNLGTLAAHGLVNDKHALGLFLQAANVNGLAARAEGGQRAVTATFYSGWRKGLRHPRTLPERIESALRGVPYVASQPLAELPRELAPETAPERPPSTDVAALWSACSSVLDDRAVASYLDRRGIDPVRVADEDLARAIPLELELPRWARFRGQPWNASGHRLVVRMFDGTGAAVSLHARSIDPGAPASDKAAAAADAEVRGSLMACGLARQVLERGAAPEWWPRSLPLSVVVTEGEPDFLTAVQRWTSEGCETAPAVVGVVSGSWDASIAARFPRGSRVTVWTHHDASGDRYAAKVNESLSARCVVLRAPRMSTGESDG